MEMHLDGCNKRDSVINIDQSSLLSFSFEKYVFTKKTSDFNTTLALNTKYFFINHNFTKLKINCFVTRVFLHYSVRSCALACKETGYIKLCIAPRCMQSNKLLHSVFEIYFHRIQNILTVITMYY